MGQCSEFSIELLRHFIQAFDRYLSPSGWHWDKSRFIAFVTSQESYQICWHRNYSSLSSLSLYPLRSLRFNYSDTTGIDIKSQESTLRSQTFAYQRFQQSSMSGAAQTVGIPWAVFSALVGLGCSLCVSPATSSF